MRRRISRAGFTMPEMLMASGIGAIVCLAVIGIGIYTSLNYQAIFNYADLDDANRLAMDQMTSDIRQAQGVWSAATDSLVLASPDLLDGSQTNHIAYLFDRNAGTVRRFETNYAGVVISSRLLLRGCENWTFSLGQRNVDTNSTPYVGLPIESGQSVIRDTAKVIDIAWNCSRRILGSKVNTESVQTARVVIRKQCL